MICANTFCAGTDGRDNRQIGEQFLGQQIVALPGHHASTESLQPSAQEMTILRYILIPHRLLLAVSQLTLAQVHQSPYPREGQKEHQEILEPIRGPKSSALKSLVFCHLTSARLPLRRDPLVSLRKVFHEPLQHERQ